LGENLGVDRQTVIRDQARIEQLLYLVLASAEQSESEATQATTKWLADIEHEQVNVLSQPLSYVAQLGGPEISRTARRSTLYRSELLFGFSIPLRACSCRGNPNDPGPEQAF
jgi:hypothetical protein